RRAFALHFDDAADLLDGVDVDADPALRGDIAFAFEANTLELLADNLDGLFHVAVGLDKGGLAFHHRGVCAVAERLDGGSGDLAHGSFVEINGKFLATAGSWRWWAYNSLRCLWRATGRTERRVTLSIDCPDGLRVRGGDPAIAGRARWLGNPRTARRRLLL